jgi:hypothetical protein
VDSEKRTQSPMALLSAAEKEGKHKKRKKRNNNNDRQKPLKEHQ